LRERQLGGAIGLSVDQIDVGATVGVHRISKRTAIAGEISGTSFPLEISDPGALPGGDINQGDVVISPFFVGCDQHSLAIGRDRGAAVKDIALMGRKVLELAAGDVDAVSVGVGDAGVGSIGVYVFSVGAPEGVKPLAVFGLLVGEFADRLGLPVEQGDVGGGGILGAVGDGEGAAVGRPLRAVFGDVGSIGQVDDVAAITGNGEEVVEFSSTKVLLEDDPPAVGGPDGAGLNVVGLEKLNGPSSGSGDFPDVVAAGEVGGEDNLAAVGGPCGSRDVAGVIKLRNGDRARRGIRGRDDGLTVR